MTLADPDLSGGGPRGGELSCLNGLLGFRDPIPHDLDSREVAGLSFLGRRVYRLNPLNGITGKALLSDHAVSFQGHPWLDPRAAPG
ncbi:MAG: hypothetical protein CMI21_06215 [Opitutae bacterium]|nr:hypothetical protein [Opitutae bacterium]